MADTAAARAFSSSTNKMTAAPSNDSGRQVGLLAAVHGAAPRVAPTIAAARANRPTPHEVPRAVAGLSIQAEAAGRVGYLLANPVVLARQIIGDARHRELVGLGLPGDLRGGLLHVAQHHYDELIQRRSTINALRKAMAESGACSLDRAPPTLARVGAA
jgi:hypothetical protein